MAIHSVSEVNHFIKGMLDAEGSLQRIMVRGEISNFKTYRSGHCYFTLKDADAALKCVMFRSRAQYLSFVPQDGQQVVSGIMLFLRVGVHRHGLLCCRTACNILLPNHDLSSLAGGAVLTAPPAGIKIVALFRYFAEAVNFTAGRRNGCRRGRRRPPRPCRRGRSWSRRAA